MNAPRLQSQIKNQQSKIPSPSRREFLKISLSSAATISLATTCPAFISRLAFAQPTTAPSTVANDNILVVVQLSGGNDGLNTVIPFKNVTCY
jgi:uncharacterized protein (DUF1501 family)